MINLFRMSLIVLVGVAIWAFAPATAHAIRAHVTVNCDECHKVAAGSPRSTTGNVCVTCHAKSGSRLARFDVGAGSNAMGSNPSVGSGSGAASSHFWGPRTTFKSAAGSANPSTTFYKSSMNFSTNLITCTICHDPHGEANTKLVRATTAGDLICQQCHSQWNVANPNALLTHPIVADYLANFAASDVRFKPATVDANGRLSTNVDLGDVRLVNGGISCTSCHATHYADSSSATTDGAASYNDDNIATFAKGDGKLLRSDGALREVLPFNAANSIPQAQLRSNLCQTCHAYKLHGKTSDGGPQIGCLDCHSGHSYNGGTPNVYVLRRTTSTFAPRYGNAYTTDLDLMDTITGKYSAPYNLSTNDIWSDRGTGGTVGGYCEACHGDIYSIGSTSHQQAGQPCMSCHLHDAPGWEYSFKPDSSAATCGQCHGFPPYKSGRGDRPQEGGLGVDGGYAYSTADTSDTLNPTGGAWNYNSHAGPTQTATYFKDEATTAHKTHAGGKISAGEGNPGDWYFVGSSGNANCEVCHGVGAGNDSRHRDNTRYDSFRDLSFAGVATTDGHTPSYAVPAWTCSNTYCHSNGGPRDGIGGRTYVALTSPAWVGNGATDGFGAITGKANRCQFCHGNDAGTMNSKSNSAVHQKHVGGSGSLKNYGCNVCHDYTAASKDALATNASRGDLHSTDVTAGLHVNDLVDVNYDTAFNLGAGNLLYNTTYGDAFGLGQRGYTAAAGTCQVYCHSNGGSTYDPLTYKTPDWDGGSSDCKFCHNSYATSGAAMTSGRHSQHINGAVTAGPTGTIGRPMTCAECHSLTASSDTVIGTPANHINGAVNIGIAADANKTNCTDIKCHSNGNLDGTITYQAAGDYSWDTDTIGCASCHGNGTVSYPTYANGGIGNNSNSHVVHVAGGIACGECHASVSTDGTAINGTTPANHVNQIIEVSGPKFTWTSGTETCSAITCHGSGSAQWGATALACGSCHQNATTDTDDFIYGNATQAVIATNEWTYSGHGKPSGSNYDVTGRAGANFPGSVTTGDPCKFCHDGTVTHNAANYFRLRQNGEADLNGVCLGCHETGSAGVDPDGSGADPAYASKNSTVKVNKYHQGAKHGDPRDGGRWCWDCHDPHGDASAAGSRIQMIQKRAQVNPNANGVPASLTGTDIVFTNRTVGAGAGGFARDITGAGAAAGICNACHTTTSQYTNATGVVLHTTAVCTGCHNHNPDNVYDGNAFQGSGCNGCHGSTGNGQYWPDGTGGSPAYVDDSAGSATTHNNHITAIGAYLGYTPWTTTMYNDTQQKTICAFCHATPGATGHDTNGGGDSIVDVLGAGQFTKFTGVGATATDTGSGAYAAGSCATLACHNGVATPASWNTPPAANCTTLCHGPNTVATAREGHQKHVVSKGYACTECHVNNGTNYGHINGEVNLVFTNVGSKEQTYGAGDGSYSQAANSVPRDGIYGNCGNMYCHADKLSPNWDQTIAPSGCTDCHTAGGSALFNPVSGLHTGAAPTVSGVKHDDSITGGCAACHTVAALGTHVNGVFSGDGNVAGDRTNMGLIAGYTPVGTSNNGTGTCAGGTVGGASCHAGGDAGSWARKWDSSISYGTLVSGTPCAGCHGGFGGTDWTFGSVSNTSDGSVEHNRNWDGDGNTSEVIGNHKDNSTNSTRCNICHVYADAPYTSAAFTTYHRNSNIEMNSAMGYSTGSRDCATSCHANNTAHNLEASGWTVANVAGPALSCYTCHGNGVDQYWPNSTAYPNRAGKHQAHITKLAAKLALGAGPYTQAQQQRMCAYCHNDATDIGGLGGQTGHAVDTATPTPLGTADVGAFNPIWDVTSPPSEVDAGSAESAGTCTSIDCHFNKTAAAGTYGWYDTPATSACVMCHVDVTNGAIPASNGGTHVAHTGSAATFGMTIGCDKCHQAATNWSTNTPPASGHIDSTFTVAGSVPFTYSAGSCGTNTCHTSGRYVTAALQAPKTSSYTWGTTLISGCDACHETTNVLATGSHTAHLTTTSQAITCNSCHTAATVGTHIDAAINFTGAASQYNSSTPEPMNDETFTSCGINTCHNNGKNGAAYNNNLGVGQYFWNTAIGGVNSCTECHNNAALGELHSNHTGAATLFGINNVTCDSCHTAGAAAGTHSGHVEGTIALVAGLAYSGTPNSVNVTLATFGTCNTTTCHSNGRGGAVLTPAWNDASSTGDDCTICHGNTGATLSTSGAHNTHLGAVAWGPHPTGSTNCSECHLSPANNTSMATYATHINGTVSLTGPFEVATGAMATDTTATTCNNCHGGLTAANAAAGAKKSWAAAPRIACETCHGDYTVANTQANGLGANAPNNAGTGPGSYDTSGHGKAGIASACTACHDIAGAGHIDGISGNATRLKSVNGQTYGARYAAASIDFCGLACHATSMKLHYDNGLSGASFPPDNNLDCITCHNPHGQNLDVTSTALATMIRPTIDGKNVVNFYNKGTQNNYFVDPPNNGGNNRYGICQVCHVPADASASGGTIGNFNQSIATPTHQGSQLCTDCHKHTDNPAFQASGGGCNGCHGYPPVQQLGVGTAGYPYASGANAGKAKVEDYPGGGRAHAVLAHINPATLPDPALNDWTPCAPCHTQTDHDMALGVGNLSSRRNTPGLYGLDWNDVATFNRYPRLRVNTSYNKGGTATYNMGNPATPAAGMGNCSNTTCHFGESPKWDCLPADLTNDPQ